MVVVVDQSTDDLLSLIGQDIHVDQSVGNIEKLLPAWLTYLARSIVCVPRKVIKSTRVVALQQQFPAICKIEKLFQESGNLRPYLHKKIYSASENEFADPLFLDWGLHHFHLGSENGTDSVERCGWVLFAKVAASEVYFLDVKQHGKGHGKVWVDEDLLRALVEVAPDLAKQFEVKGIVGLSHTASEEDAIKLRKAGASRVIVVDGRFFAMIGHGIHAQLGSVKSARRADQFFLEREEILRRLKIEEIKAKPTALAPYAMAVVIVRANFREGRIVLFDQGSKNILLESCVVD